MIQYSFIIPHKDNCSSLCRLLKTIPKRTDVEIIVVDDNSNEKPVLNDPMVNVIFLNGQQSKGAGRARNIGLENARGRWILFADCDDYYEENFIDVLDQFVKSDYDIIFFDAFFYYDVECRTSGHSLHSDDIKNFLNNQDSKKYRNLLKHCDNSVWSRMYSKKFLDIIGAKFEERTACNDGWFVQYASSRTDNIMALPNKLYYYVRNEQSTTFKKQSEIMFWDRLEAGCKIRNLLVEIGASNALVRHFSLDFYKRAFKTQSLRFFFRLLLYHFCHDVSFFTIFYWKLKKKVM